MTRISATLLLLFSASVSATCYWPTGNETYGRDLYEHMPCSNDTTSPLSTICCALNRTNVAGGDIRNGRTNDECLPNGICRNRVLNSNQGMAISYWRETCTSKDWKTGLCLDICSDDWTSGNGTTGAIMTPCDGTAGSLKWCCGNDLSCCDNPSKYKLLPFEFRGALPNTASATSRPFTVPATGTPTGPTSTPTVTSLRTDNDNNGSGGLSTGAKAGIGVGAGIGGLILIALGFIIARRTGRKEAATGGKADEPYITPEHDPMLSPGLAPPPEKHVYRHEMEHQQRAELEYNPARPDARKQTPSYELS